VDLRDVGMVERGQDLCFAPESCKPVGIAREQFGKNFQGDVTMKLRIARSIDLTHASRAHQRENFVGTEPRAGSQSHRVLGRVGL
jgi:hypothetical protein